MSTLPPSKLYTIDHAWQSGRDLKIKCQSQPIYWVIFHTMRIFNTCTVTIHDKSMSGPMLCAGVLDRTSGFTYKTAGHDTKHHLQRRGGLSIWEQDFQFRPAKGAMLAWKQARPGMMTSSWNTQRGPDPLAPITALPAQSEQENSSAPALGQGDWILVAVNHHYDDEGNRNETPDKVLALYSAPKGMSQQARIYFVEELGTEMEVGALAVILGIIRWNYTRPGKLLASSFSSTPGFLG